MATATITPKRLDDADAARLLKAQGIVPTRQRIQIASVLLARTQHLSADELMRRVNSGSSRVSKATIYNTLALFAGKGLVREVIVDRAKVFYDSNTSHHHHIYDADTRSLTDVEADQVEVVGLPALPEDTEIEGVDVVVRVRRRS